MKIKLFRKAALWVLIFLGVVIQTTAQSLFSISEHNPKSHVVHMMEVDGNLFSILPTFNSNNIYSGFKIYKSNFGNNITDSLVIEYPQMQTRVTNFIKENNGILKFGVSIDSIINGFHKVKGFRFYKINADLQILDSIEVMDENFWLNRLLFCNLIQGPEDEFICNVVFNRENEDGTLPYNVYYRVNGKFNYQNKYSDSTHFADDLYSTSFTTNMMFYKKQYVMVKTSIGTPNPSTKVVRLSQNLDLLYDSIILYGTVFNNLFHSPLEINNRWIIGCMEYVFGFGNNPNFIEISDDNKFLAKSTFNNFLDDFNDNVSNYGAFYNAIEQKVYLTSNLNSEGKILHYCYDTSFTLLWAKSYSFPVNKIDTIYTNLSTNGMLWYNNQFYFYGVKQELSRWREIHGPSKPFIVTGSLLEEGIVNGQNVIRNASYTPILYPNPFKEELNLKEFEGIFTLSIFDVRGDLVLLKEMERDIKIKVDELESGLYFYKLQTANGQFHSGKIVKE
ncbi:MAG: T9SS type A sorting domain-containing protein [Bacteroidia bacterium]|nr:T9SS type A sorting domain-containing protein [Bacteroidia bacterium]